MSPAADVQIMNTTNTAPAASPAETRIARRAALVATYRRLGRSMAAFETLSDGDYRALRREREQVSAAIDAIDAEVIGVDSIDD